MATAVKEIPMWCNETAETEPVLAVFDGRDWWIRDIAEKHYVGTFGQHTAIYGNNPDGVCYYRVRWEPLANGYVHCEDRTGNYEKRFEGQEFKKLQTIFANRQPQS